MTTAAGVKSNSKREYTDTSHETKTLTLLLECNTQNILDVWLYSTSEGLSLFTWIHI